MTPKEIHELSQAAADVREHFVPLLYSFYKQCISEGFNEKQAFELTKLYMKVIAPPPEAPNEE